MYGPHFSVSLVGNNYKKRGKVGFVPFVSWLCKSVCEAAAPKSSRAADLLLRAQL